MVQHKPTLLALVALSLLGSSCALTDPVLTLAYPPPSQQSEVRPARVPTASILQLVAVTDERQHQDAIGDVRNGWGMRIARIRTDDDPREWIERALTYELEHAGHELSTTKVPDADRVSVALERAFCPDDTDYRAEVRLLILVERGDRHLLRRTYEARAGLAGDDATAQDVLAKALRKALRSFLADYARVAANPNS